MLSLVDCLGICDLTEDEIDAIAFHEHVPDIIAVEFAEYLIHSDEGVPMISRIILDDIEEAKRLGHHDQAEKLNHVLKHFVVTHPEYTGIPESA